MNNNQIINGSNNIQVMGDYTTVNNLHITNNFELSEFRAFEKVLYSIPPERFLEEILKPFMERNMPGKSLNDFKLMLP